jgi:hypothetical protein
MSKTAYYSPELRERWPTFAIEWAHQFPDIFDDRDLEQTSTRPSHHFHEWFAAIHIYHRYGLLSLVEKAQFFGRHPRKKCVVERVMSADTCQHIHDVVRECGVQWPDLLVYSPHRKGLWFAEVKGPGDRLREEQLESHRLIRKLGVKVRVIKTLPGPSA